MKINCGSELVWRGGLPPLGREAAPKLCDCFAAERGQAPSPQARSYKGRGYLG
jgi:hypothetical protein